jgi:broad specificity phosphatase PhoE
MRLTLVRHAETPANVRGELDTAPPGPGLTERGEAQAQALVERFAEVEFDTVFASILTRTQLTAAPIAAARNLPIQVLDGLREFSVGVLEDRSDPEAIGIFVEVMRRWLLGDHTPSIGGGESGEEILQRMDSVVEYIAEHSAAPLVVSHGGIIRVWAAARASNIDSDFAVANYVVNTGVIVLDGKPGQWHCVSWDSPPPR